METRLKSTGLVLFIAVFLALCLLPFVGMLWAPTRSTSGTAEPASLPAVVQEDGSANLAYLSQLGFYFEDHFAYRNLAVDLDARLKVTLFNVSPTAQVVVGSDGWLYYGGELDDYLGTTPLTPRKAKNIAHNLALMQGYANAMDSQLLFVVAPNKSSLYPGHMPYYYLDSRDASMELLGACLEEKGVAYVDLFELFTTQDEELYCKTDSHWNDVGALLVTNALLKACDKDGAVVQSSFEDLRFYGDIEKMLYPITAQPEARLTYSTGDWVYANATSSVEDGFIETASSGTGSVLMFRDSFADSLIPLLAPEFQRAYFSKYIPYDLTQIETLKPDYVLIERTQRHVGLLAENPAILLAPSFRLEATDSIASTTTVEVVRDGDFWVIQGWVDESCIDEDDDVFILLEGPEGAVCYVPFRISGTVNQVTALEEGVQQALPGRESDYGYKAYFSSSVFIGGDYMITILVAKADAGGIVAVASIPYTP